MPVPRKADTPTNTGTPYHSPVVAVHGQGLDILGPCPKSIGGYEWLYVAIDKFTKWLEATAVVKANKNSAFKFVNDLVACFGIPNRIITDNGTQFTSNLFGDYCDNMGIKLCFTSVAHPRSNGQVERANVEILKGQKTRI